MGAHQSDIMALNREPWAKFFCVVLSSINDYPDHCFLVNIGFTAISLGLRYERSTTNTMIKHFPEMECALSCLAIVNLYNYNMVQEILIRAARAKVTQTVPLPVRQEVEDGPMEVL